MTHPPQRPAETPDRLLTVEPFSVAGAGGGPRIMRSLLTDAPVPVLAVATSPRRSAEVGTCDHVPEIHVPARPSLGRLESTRAVRGLGALDAVLLDRLTHRLARLVVGSGRSAPPVPTMCLHAVPHSLDFVAVQRVAARLRLPMFLSMHDDPGYALHGRVERKYALRRLEQAWRSAHERFVIAEEMGLEMCRRYGERSYVIVTDGLGEISSAPRPRVAGRLSVYFMGAAHISYAENFQCLLKALARHRDEGIDARLITRSGDLPFRVDAMGVPIASRPWAPQADVVRDLDEVDVSYMPLPFGADHAGLVRFSMSTKMVTYLGSGVPILFHGPRGSAAGNLLRQADAALLAGSLDVRAVADILNSVGVRGPGVAENALRLARQRFLLPEIRARFWRPILELSERDDTAHRHAVRGLGDAGP